MFQTQDGLRTQPHTSLRLLTPRVVRPNSSIGERDAEGGGTGINNPPTS